MSSSASRGTERTIHQDYIARIRYSNTLPPPPNPPKLLDIPNTGLASGQYTTPGFASRLARDQPLNIEADAELGMPLDLVGMPGIFDGDESSIQAPLQVPAPHPHDRPLLRSLATLGKPKFSDSGVSFLRRTEYISSYTSKSRFESTTSRSLIDNVGNRKKRVVQSIDKESPEYIKTQVENSFKIAAQNIKNRTQIRHPTKKNLHLIDAYPLLPDIDAFPDAGGYVQLKFLTNPVPPSNTYDIRIENSLLLPVATSDEEEQARKAAREAHERDPEQYPPPDDTMQYEFFMADTPSGALSFKRKFDVLDPEHDDEELYTEKNSEGEGCFKYKRIRAYESASITWPAQEKYDNEVVIALHDGKDGLHQKGAYYYPLVQSFNIRPQRQKNIDKKMKRIFHEEEPITDQLDVRVEDPDEELTAERNKFRENPMSGEPEDGGLEPSSQQDGGSSSPERNGDGHKSD
ncbi:RNA polymerase II-associated [Tricladium varicosporioides]|nr:RNA polymerase II-associated [Hymenoscyphus varicosporioides]